MLIVFFNPISKAILFYILKLFNKQSHVVKVKIGLKVKTVGAEGRE